MTEQNKVTHFLELWIKQQHHKLAHLERLDQNALWHRSSCTLIYFGEIPPDIRSRISEHCSFLIEINEEIDEILTNNILDQTLINEGVIERSIF